uniref:DRBM domain-containing protein n=1 Tax=Amphiprion ocellaris TaxID=80972 RepID=A0A3Q1CT92_AMPOC
MQDFAITNDKTKRPVALRTKTLADLLESFIAALYIDKDLEFVHTFMNVCFFPRLKEFILNQDWNDPKSQLQQCCLTLRTEGKEPDIPLYKTLQTVGPSHARTYTVAVYFKGERIGCGKGPSIQQAEMGAAMDALEKCKCDTNPSPSTHFKPFTRFALVLNISLQYARWLAESRGLTIRLAATYRTLGRLKCSPRARAGRRARDGEPIKQGGSRVSSTMSIVLEVCVESKVCCFLFLLCFQE